MRPDNRQTIYERDAFGRISRADYSDGSWEAFSYDKRGLLCGAANANSRVVFQRDDLGRVISEQQLPGEGTSEDGIQIESEYNLFGERIRLVSSLGAEQTAGYNGIGLLEQLQSDREGSKRWESNIRYDEAGREIERFASGGLSIQTQYDTYGSMSGRFVYKGKELRGYRIFSWGINDKLITLKSHLLSSPVIFDYDKVGNLNYSSCGVYERLFKAPDIIGNIYRDKERKDRVYDRGGRLLKDKEHYYRYDGEGNLILKSRRNVLEPPVMPHPKDWLDKLFTRTTPNDKDLQAHYGWQQGDTVYEWYGNVPLHEWTYPLSERPSTIDDSDGKRTYATPEPQTELTTWVFDEGTFVPSAKLVGDRRYSIISDYLGTPIEAYDEEGQRVWARELDIYGRTRSEVGESGFIPFLYQGQYLDTETGLAYNRFRYYSPETGAYISQDPIRLEAGLTNLYAYVHDVNSWVDPCGLTGTYMFTDGETWYIGKGAKNRMYVSMKERVGGKANVTQGIHIDYGNSQIGLMVEAELMRRKNAVADSNFGNAINSPGERLLANAQKDNKTLYNDIIQKADDFEAKFDQQKGKGIKCH